MQSGSVVRVLFSHVRGALKLQQLVLQGKLYGELLSIILERIAFPCRARPPGDLQFSMRGHRSPKDVSWLFDDNTV